MELTILTKNISEILKEPIVLRVCICNGLSQAGREIKTIKRLQMNRNTSIYVAAALLLAEGAGSQAQSSYTLQTITAPAGTRVGVAEAMNNLGHVVGSSIRDIVSGKKTTTVPGPPFLWASGNADALPPASGRAQAEAHGLSDTDWIVGESYNVVNGYRRDHCATLWVREANGNFSALNLNSLVPGSESWSYAASYAVAEDGRFVAVEASAGVFLLEFVQSEVVVHPLGETYIWDLRVSGADLRIAGSKDNRAFRWNWESGMEDLHGMLPGTSFGTAINENHEVAGVYRVNGANRPAYWNAAGTFVDIFGGTASGGYATGINPGGNVVGWATVGNPARTVAFRWHASCGVEDLNSLKSPSNSSGINLNWAGAINDSGAILARGSTKSTGSVYVLMTPQ
jgi:hypothetical protein